MSDRLFPLLSRFASALSFALLFSLAARACAVQRAPEYGFCLYAVQLAVTLTLLAGAPCLVLATIERALPRGRLLSFALFLLGLTLLLSPLTLHLSSGDGLRARGIAPGWVQWSALGVLLSIGAAVWSYRLWARRRPLDLSLAALFCAGLAFAAWILQQAQRELSALFVVLACALATFAAQLLLKPHKRMARAVTWVVLGVAGAALALGALQPEQRAGGQRLALVTESWLGYAASVISASAPAVALPPRTKERCRTALAPPSLPRWSEPAERRRNVIFISIDTVRADMLERRRPNGAPLMPALRSFMAESRRAARAHAAFPATLLSLSAALTGNLPSDLLLSRERYATVFEQTRERFDHREVILPRGNYFRRPDVRAALLPDIEVSQVGSAPRQTRYAIQLLDQLRAEGRRHFVWIHYFEPHEPYVSHDEVGLGQGDFERYQSELAYVDEQLGRLLESLRAGGWYEDSLIAVFSDHGESFGEHGHAHHHYLVYPWLVSVPFALHAPGLAPGVFAGPVQLMDLTPTVLQFVDVAPVRPMRGWPLLSADPPARRSLYSEELSVTGGLLLAYRAQPPASEAAVLARFDRLEKGPGYASKLAVAQGASMLIARRDSGAPELYDMERDPRALRDLADAERPERARLEADALALRRSVLMRALCELNAAESSPSYKAH